MRSRIKPRKKEKMLEFASREIPIQQAQSLKAWSVYSSVFPFGHQPQHQPHQNARCLPYQSDSSLFLTNQALFFSKKMKTGFRRRSDSFAQRSILTPWVCPIFFAIFASTRQAKSRALPWPEHWNSRPSHTNIPIFSRSSTEKVVMDKKVKSGIYRFTRTGLSR